LEDKCLQIKEMLFRNTLTQNWLINRLQEHGVKTDKTELSAILNKRRKGNKVTLVLDTSLLILRDYEKRLKLLDRGVETNESKR